MSVPSTHRGSHHKSAASIRQTVKQADNRQKQRQHLLNAGRQEQMGPGDKQGKKCHVLTQAKESTGVNNVIE